MSEALTLAQRPLPRLFGAAAVWAFLLWSDLHTKELARDLLPEQPAIPVIEGFWNWRYAENRDVGFSLLRVIPEDFRQYVIYGLVTLGILAVLVYGVRRWQSLLALSGATLVLSGAVGNLTDRVLRGFVTDFIQWYYGTFYWPVFNLADVYVVVGVGLLMIYEWRQGASAAQQVQAA